MCLLQVDLLLTVTTAQLSKQTVNTDLIVMETHASMTVRSFHIMGQMMTHTDVFCHTNN